VAQRPTSGKSHRDARARDFVVRGEIFGLILVLMKKGIKVKQKSVAVVAEKGRGMLEL